MYSERSVEPVYSEGLTAPGTRSEECTAPPTAPAPGAVRRPVSPGEPVAPGPWTMRLRISGTDPWSVMVASFLLLTGLGVVALATAAVAWLMVEGIAPGVLPDLTTVVAVAVAVVTLEVVLGTCLATLSTFLYNISAQYNGGVEVAVTDDLGPTPAAVQALLFMARARARTRRYLRRGRRNANRPFWHSGCARDDQVEERPWRPS
ncbi:DUF3566 domain-containing protein [Streptomyces yokosukanensis]|uniref:DUF3566 domain-containing protein n=1 Tax=Streptomyces yokosukanensis TaxID=67386 RepID=UPI00341294BE